MLTRHVILAAVLAHLSAGCGKDRLIDEGGMPAQLGKLKCGSSIDDVVRAYPDFVKKGDAYVRTTGNERVAVTLDNGSVVGGTVFDFVVTPEKFGKRLEQLEDELGKGTVHDGAKKAVYWDPKSGALGRVILVGDAKSVDLSTLCGTSSTQPEADDVADGLPAPCHEYKASVERLSRCDKASQKLRDGMRQAYEQSAATWMQMSPDRKALLATACREATNSTVNLGKALCGW